MWRTGLLISVTSDNYLDRRLRSIKNTNVEELRHDSAFEMSRTRSIAGGRRGMVSRRHLRFCNQRWFFNTSYLGHTFFWNQVDHARPP